MENIDVRAKVIEILALNFIFVDNNETDNVDISLYIEDSIQFVSFVVELERAFCIEIPDELLTFDRFRYLDNICIILEEILSNNF